MNSVPAYSPYVSIGVCILHKTPFSLSKSDNYADIGGGMTQSCWIDQCFCCFPACLKEIGALVFVL
ncbi:MAG: hypothetical protein HY860_01530 [Chlamydiales bacterium]|nr:hypothetical protein [Chlamydiales bacterium]